MNSKSQRKEASEILQHYGVSPDEEILQKIETYTSLLLRWNERIALTSIIDRTQILRFHFGESIFAASAIHIDSGMIADVGAGAGFPGIPLKLVRPQLHLTLIESNLKKCAFLSEVVRALEIRDVEIFRNRFDLFKGTDLQFVVSRAISHPEEVLSWSRSTLKTSGKAIFWLGADDAASMPQDLVFWKWSQPIQIPGSERRVLLSVQKK